MAAPHEVFVGNPTYQHRRFQFRVPRVGGPEGLLEIPQGEQRKIPREFSDDGLKDIVDQLQRAGGVEANKPGDLTKPGSLIYTVSPKPIKADQIDEAREKDIDARQDLSGDMVQGLGLGLLEIQERTLKSQGADPRKLQETGLTIRQLTDQRDPVPEENGVDAEFVSSRKERGRGRRGRES